MPEYALKLHRYDPESGEPAYWEDFDVELPDHERSVLDGILQAARTQDGSIGIRCSCQAAICGSCGGAHQRQDRAWPATRKIGQAAEEASARGIGEIVVEPMGNCPVHQGPDRRHGRGPLEEGPARGARGCCPRATRREREYIVPAESMIDVTQSMACIQCGACVGACLSLEVDPEFVGPAALAKAYRFVGDPRDGADRGAPEGPGRGSARHLRLHALLRTASRSAPRTSRR